MSSPFPPEVCVGCRHFAFERVVVADAPAESSEPEVRFVCAAFPAGRGIPDAIVNGENDHREPVEGDHGIRFEPV
jgi:hypothetical protein